MSKAQEAERVDAWRAEQFLRMGFTPEQAAELVEWGIDTGAAWELTEVGCPPALALRILRPLEDTAAPTEPEQFSVKV